MGNARTLYLVYGLTILACLYFLRVGYRIYNLPKKGLIFIEALKKTPFENVPEKALAGVRTV